MIDEVARFMFPLVYFPIITVFCFNLALTRWKKLTTRVIRVYVSSIFSRPSDPWQNISIVSQTFFFLIPRDSLSPAITNFTHLVCLSKWFSIGEFWLLTLVSTGLSLQKKQCKSKWPWCLKGLVKRSNESNFKPFCFDNKRNICSLKISAIFWRQER